MSKTTHTVINALYGFIFGVALYFAGTIMVWSFYPYSTAEIQTPIKVLNENKEVAINGVIIMELNIDKRTDVFPDVTRNVICDSGRTYQVPNNQVTAPRPKGTYVSTVKFDMADTLLVGEHCFFRFTNDYKVNPIRSIVKTWDSEIFTITAKE